MSNFHHHADSIIYIRLNDYSYQDTLENFLLDCATLLFNYTGLPAGYIERYYNPQRGHFLSTENSQNPQRIPWVEGDNLIILADAFLVVQQQRIDAQDTRTDNQKKLDIIKQYCRLELSNTKNIIDICAEENEMVIRLLINTLDRTYTITQHNELLTYRRNLRLFMITPNDLDNPTYPTKPIWI